MVLYFGVCILDNLANEIANLAYMSSRARLGKRPIPRVSAAELARGTPRDIKPPPHAMSSRTPFVPPTTAFRQINDEAAGYVSRSLCWWRAMSSMASGREHEELAAHEKESHAGRRSRARAKEKRTRPGPLWLIVNSIMQNLRR